MGLFDWLRKKPRPTIADPVFGELTFNAGCWNGRTGFPGSGSTVAVSVDAGERGPTPAHHRAFRELEARYPDLRAGIGDALWSLYRPMREAIDGSDDIGRALSSRLNGPAAMLEATTLDAVHLAEDGAVRLLYGFVPEVGWDDAMLSIGFEGWQPVPISLDD